MSTSKDTFLVDIICPVYNKSKVIEVFLNSFKQNLPNKYFNLILINDGSTDKTSHIVSNYLCDNITIVNKNNEGVSIARNNGLERASAKYIWFCDPDDEIIADGVALVNMLQKEDADLYVFSYMESNFTNSKFKQCNFYSNESLTFKEYLLKYDYFSKTNGISTLWNKVFKRSTIGELIFDKTLSNAEDRMFNINVLSQRGKCRVCNIAIYNHIIYDEGTLSTIKSKKKFENVKKVNEKNIQVLSSLKKDVTYEQKLNILILCKELLLLGKNEAHHFYFNQHHEKKIKIFPLIKVSEFFFMIPKNQYIFNLLKNIKHIFKN